MKITQIQTFPIQPAWLLVRVDTDEGITGWGECLPDKALVQAAAVHSFDHYLLGEDPRRIIHHWQSMYRGAFWRGNMTTTAAMSGLEQAMWDILGKWLGVPVYQLLGGAVRDRIKVYAHAHGANSDEMVAKAKTAPSKTRLCAKPTWSIAAGRLMRQLPMSLPCAKPLAQTSTSLLTSTAWQAQPCR